MSGMLMLTPSTHIAAEAAARHEFFHATATVANQVLRWELERFVRPGGGGAGGGKVGVEASWEKSRGEICGEPARLRAIQVL